jgi:hypothetical protein
MKNESTFGTIKSLSSFLTGFGIRQVISAKNIYFSGKPGGIRADLSFFCFL